MKRTALQRRKPLKAKRWGVSKKVPRSATNDNPTAADEHRPVPRHGSKGNPRRGRTPTPKSAGEIFAFPTPGKKEGTKHSRRPREWGRMAYIRSRECVLRAYDCRGQVEAHHAGEHGMGNRPPDDTVISLCDGHHDALHDGGEPFSSWGKASIRDWSNREIAKARAAWDALSALARAWWDEIAKARRDALRAFRRLEALS